MGDTCAAEPSSSAQTSFRNRDCGCSGLRGATIRGRVAGDSHRWQSIGKVGCAGTGGLAGRTLRFRQVDAALRKSHMGIPETRSDQHPAHWRGLGRNAFARLLRPLRRTGGLFVTRDLTIKRIIAYARVTASALSPVPSRIWKTKLRRWTSVDGADRQQ